jgi:hypothetical protein
LTRCETIGGEQIFPLIEKAEHSALAQFGRNGDCVLASMQTLHETRLHRWAPDSFDYIVIDEAHCFGYEKIVAYFECAQYLGLTATPLRSDDRSLKEFFHYPYIRTLSMREAIEGKNNNTGEYEKPFLSRVEVLPIDASHIDLTGIKIVGRDYDARELDKRIWEHTNWLAMRFSRPRPICRRGFTAAKSRRQKRFLRHFATWAPRARPIIPKSPIRAKHSRRFIAGDLQYLSNVNMLIKGVNVPKSPPLFACAPV